MSETGLAPLTPVITGGRRVAGHLWGFPSSTCLVQLTDGAQQSPCSGWGGDVAVILMGEGGTASRTFQQSIALQAMVLTHFRILRAVHTEGPKPVAHRLAESFPI